MTQRVLVTGGAGFIGSHLTEALLAEGLHVRVVDDESTGSFLNLSAVAGHPALELVAGSVTDRELVQSAVSGCDRVYHLAAAVGVALIAERPIETIERNVVPVQWLLDAVRRESTADRPVRFFLASTSEVYGKNQRDTWRENDDLVFGPTTCMRWSYGVTKAIDEFLTLAYHRQHGVDAWIGRFFNVVGPRQTGSYGMVLPRFVAAARANQPLVVHDDGKQQRCFAHVGDVITALLQLSNLPDVAGKIVNIGSDQPITIESLARRVIERGDSRSTITHQAYHDAYSHEFQDVRRRVPDLSQLRRLLPTYAPQYDIDQIIDELVAG